MPERINIPKAINKYKSVHIGEKYINLELYVGFTKIRRSSIESISYRKPRLGSTALILLFIILLTGLPLLGDFTTSEDVLEKLLFEGSGSILGIIFLIGFLLLLIGTVYEQIYRVLIIKTVNSEYKLRGTPNNLKELSDILSDDFD